MTKKHRIKTLNTIFSRFQAMSQWLPGSPDYVYKDHLHAEALIEILEVEDCGSVGGYDINNPITTRTGYHLYSRFLALVAKYNNKADIKSVCYFDVDKLTEYFGIIAGTRETFNK